MKINGLSVCQKYGRSNNPIAINYPGAAYPILKINNKESSIFLKYA